MIKNRIRKYICADNFLKAIAFCSVMLVIYAILGYGQTTIHSDTATGIILTKSQLRQGTFFPKSWNYAFGDIWVLSQGFFSALFSMLIENQSLARMLGSCLMVLLMILAIWINSRKVYFDNSWTLSIPLILLFLANENTAIESNTRDCILYQAAYTPNIMFLLLLSTATYFIWINVSRKLYCVILPLFLYLLCLAGIRNIAEIVLPLLGSVILLTILESDSEENVNVSGIIKDTFFSTMFVLIPSILGVISHNILSNFLKIQESGYSSNLAFVDSFDTITSRFRLLFSGFFNNFGYNPEASVISIHGLQNLVSIGACILLVFVVPVLQAVKIRNESKGIKFMFTFAMIHNLALIMSIILLGVGEPGGRYLLSSTVMFIIVSSRYIYIYWIKSISNIRYVWILLFSLATIIEALSLFSSTRGWRNKLRDEKQLSYELLSRDLHKGYASYWNAYNNEVFSDCKISFCGIDLENKWVTPYYWLCDTDVYYDAADKSFIILDEKEDGWAGRLYEIFGEPIDLFEMNDLHIYVYDYDVWSRMASGVCGGLNHPYVMSYSNSILLDDNTLEINPGGYAYGPNTHLFAGTYLVTYSGENMESATVEVYSEEHPETIRYEELTRTENEIVIKLTTDYPRLMDVEYRIFNNTNNVKINLETINIDK